MNLIGGLGLKKFVSIEESPAVESRSRCDTTTGDDNELFLREKFICGQSTQCREIGGLNALHTAYNFLPGSLPNDIPMEPFIRSLMALFDFVSAGERSREVFDFEALDCHYRPQDERQP